LDSGTLTTQQEKAEEKNCVVLETASWFKNAFADLGLTIDRKLKKPAPLPETLFNLEKDQSVKTVHHRHEEQQAATTAGNTPPRKGKTRLLIWQALMGIPHPRLVKIDRVPQMPSGMKIPPPLVQRMAAMKWARPMADS